MVTISKAWLTNSIKRFFSHQEHSWDWGVLLVVFALFALGLLQIYSSSYIFATESRGDGLFFVRKQLFFTAVSVVVLLVTSQISWRWIEKAGFLLWLTSAFLLLVTLIPGLGIKAGGASRWLQLPGVGNLEPSELLKISVPFLWANYLVREQNYLGKYKLFWRIIIFSTPFLILLKQPDFGSFVICSAVTLSILFVFGLPWRWIIGAGISAAVVFAGLIISAPYRLLRVQTILDPWQDASGKGFQVIQSMLGFHSGGMLGVGIGQGQGKLFFLPEAHTDFTLSVLGEEMGFVGILIVMSLFCFLVVRGLQISVKTENLYAKIVSLGLSVLLALQVFTNMGVAMGMLPTKGLTLPFLSYGGSSLVAVSFLIGVLLNIQRSSGKESSRKESSRAFQ